MLWVNLATVLLVSFQLQNAVAYPSELNSDRDNAEDLRRADSNEACSEDFELQFLRDEKNCSLFYQCIDGFKYRFHCPEDLHFDEELQLCDDAVSVRCGQDISNQRSEEVKLLLSTVQALRKQVRKERQQTIALIDSLIQDAKTMSQSEIGDRATSVVKQLEDILNSRVAVTQNFLKKLMRQKGE